VNLIILRAVDRAWHLHSFATIYLEIMQATAAMTATHVMDSAPPVFYPSVRGVILVLTLMGPTVMDTPTTKAEERPSGMHPPEQSVDLSPGGNYQAGTVLHIPGKGFTFTIPRGWHATVFEDSELPFLMSDEGRGLGMIFPLGQVTADAVEHELGQPVTLSQGVSFVPAGVLGKTETRLTRSYVSDSSIGRALALLSPAHDCVIYFLMGPEHEAGSYEQTLDELATSTRFVEKFDGTRSKEGV